MGKQSPQKALQSNRKWRNANPQKVTAHSKVNRAIRDGKMVRGTVCEDCGGVATESHHADYSKPLQVEWLCAGCHHKRHPKEKKPQPPKVKKERVRKPILPKTHPKQDDARLLHEAGNSYSQIAKALGFSRGTAYKVVNGTLYK